MLVLGSLIVFGGRGQSVPASLVSRADNSQVQPAKIQLNLEEDDLGSSSDTQPLAQKLKSVFEMRQGFRAYRPGMERRSDLPEQERIEKTVFVKAERSISLGEVASVIEAAKDAGADPVLLPIYTKGNSAKDCFTCAIRDRREGWMKPHPLILLVGLRRPTSAVPQDANGLPALDDLLVSDGLQIVLSGSASSPSAPLITVLKDGEFNFDERRIEKSALEKEIRDRIKIQPRLAKVFTIKLNPTVMFGTLEDIYRAAYAAGVKHLVLDMSGKFAP
jgi:biopolymer transport protein ExbD